MPPRPCRFIALVVALGLALLCAPTGAGAQSQGIATRVSVPMYTGTVEITFDASPGAYGTWIVAATIKPKNVWATDYYGNVIKLSGTGIGSVGAVPGFQTALYTTGTFWQGGHQARYDFPMDLTITVDKNGVVTLTVP